jgi:hypothetical protein
MNDHQGLSRRQILGMMIAAGGFAVSGAPNSAFAQALKRTQAKFSAPFTLFSDRWRRPRI